MVSEKGPHGASGDKKAPLLSFGCHELHLRASWWRDREQEGGNAANLPNMEEMAFPCKTCFPLVCLSWADDESQHVHNLSSLYSCFLSPPHPWCSCRAQTVSRDRGRRVFYFCTLNSLIRFLLIIQFFLLFLFPIFLYFFFSLIPFLFFHFLSFPFPRWCPKEPHLFLSFSHPLSLSVFVFQADPPPQQKKI